MDGTTFGTIRVDWQGDETGYIFVQNGDARFTLKFAGERLIVADREIFYYTERNCVGAPFVWHGDPGRPAQQWGNFGSHNNLVTTYRATGAVTRRPMRSHYGLDGVCVNGDRTWFFSEVEAMGDIDIRPDFGVRLSGYRHREHWYMRHQ
jgi:hypothetical protein